MRIAFSRFLRLAASAYLLVSSLLASPVAAQEAPSPRGKPFVTAYSVKDYLVHPNVFGADILPDGRVVFGTFANIIIYDGQSWQRVPTTPTIVLQVAVRNQNEIFVAGPGYLGRLVLNQNFAFEFQSLMPDLGLTGQEFGVPQSLAVHDDTLYVSTTTTVLSWKDGQTSFPEWTAQARPRLVSLDTGLFAYASGLGIFQWQDSAFTLLNDPDRFAASASNGWIATPPQGSPAIATLLVGDTGIFDVLPDGSLLPAYADAWPQLENKLLKLCRRLSNGDLLVGGQYSGAFVLQDGVGIVDTINEDLGLSNNSIYGMVEDHEGGIWLPTLSGVNHWNRSVTATYFDESLGVGQSAITQIFEYQNTIYIVNQDEVYQHHPGTNGKPASFQKLESANGTLMADALVYKGDLLVSTEKGLGRYQDGNVEILVELEGITDFFGNLTVLDRVTDRVSLAIRNNLHIFRREADASYSLEGILDLGNTPTKIAQSTNGDIWAGTFGSGTLVVDIPDNPNQIDWPNLPIIRDSEPLGLDPRERTTIAYPTNDGIIIVGNYGSYHTIGDEMRLELWDNFDIEVDGPIVLTPGAYAADQSFWSYIGTGLLGSEIPLSKFSPQPDGTYHVEPAPSPILERLGYINSTLPFKQSLPSGDVLWVTTQGTVIRWELGGQSAASSAFSPTFSQIRQADRLFDPAAKASVEIPFAKTPLQFDFSVITYQASNGLDFQTRLLGFNDQWSAFDPAPRASFTNLKGGPFTFQVRARNKQGLLSDTLAYTFTVRPPWYESRPAFAAYLLAAALLIWAYIRLRTRSLRRDRQRLEALVHARTAELATAKETAESANAAKSRFLANMSHELRTPLNAIIGYAQLMFKDKAVAPKQKEQVEIIHGSGEHLLSMINEVLDLSKIEAGRTERRDTPFSLPQLAHQIAATGEARSHKKAFQYEFIETSPLPSTVLGDGQKIRQVIENLLSNAIKFTKSGKVSLSIGYTDEHLHVRIQDTGPGITPEDQERLFEPFQQSDRATSSDAGTGLGLPIAREYVRLLGGELSLASTPGTGSVFSFSLPLPTLASDPTASASSTLSITGYLGPKKRILIVDDIAVNRRLLRDFLEPLGFETTEADSCSSALQACQSSSFDLLALDIRLGDGSSIDILPELRAKLPKTTPILGLSASVLGMDTAAALTAGFDDFLPKPFRESELYEKIGRLLRIEWTGETDPTSPSPEIEYTAAEIQLSHETLENLLTLASRGDIVALESALESAASNEADGPKLASLLNPLIKSYKMAEIRSQLQQIASV